VTDEFAKLRKELARIGRASSNLLKLMTQFERLASNPLDNAYKMDDVLDKLGELIKNYSAEGIVSELQGWVDGSKARISRLKEQFRHEFGRKLQALLDTKGFKLENRYPNLRVGLYTINIDFLKGTATILFGHEALKGKISLSPGDIAEALERIEKGLNRSFEPQRFVDLVFEAYRRVCRIRDLPLGERVPIMEVLQQFVLLSQPQAFKVNPAKEHFRGYGRVNFGYDLYRLRKSGVKTSGDRVLGLVTATFDATKKRENFLWVPDDERGNGTTYSLLYFRET